MAQPDFSFQPNVPIASIASVLANKRLQEIKLRQDQENNKQRIKQQRFQNLLQAVTLGSNLVQRGLAAAAARRAGRDKDTFASLISQADRPVSNIPFGPQGQQPTLGQTRGFRPDLLAAATKVGGAPGQAAAQEIFRNPQIQEQRSAQIELLEAQALKARRVAPPKQKAGEVLLSEFATAGFFKEHLKLSDEEIKAGVTSQGIRIPRRISVNDANALKKRGTAIFSFGGFTPTPVGEKSNTSPNKGRGTAKDIQDKFGF